MRENLKKKVIKHIEKDDKEFKGQIKDDKKLLKTVKKEKK